MSTANKRENAPADFPAMEAPTRRLEVLPIELLEGSRPTVPAPASTRPSETEVEVRLFLTELTELTEPGAAAEAQATVLDEGWTSAPSTRPSAQPTRQPSRGPTLPPPEDTLTVARQPSGAVRRASEGSYSQVVDRHRST